MVSFSCFSTVCKTDKICPRRFELKEVHVDFIISRFVIDAINYLLDFASYIPKIIVREDDLKLRARLFSGLYSTQSSYHYQ